MKPGAMIPSLGAEIEISTTRTAHGHGLNGGFRVAITVPGYINVTYKKTPDNIVRLYYGETGVYIEPGVFHEIWLPMADAAEMLPANTVVILNS